MEIPRDRAGTFEPQIITKHQTRLSGFGDKILSLYALGMTVREIQGHPCSNRHRQQHHAMARLQLPDNRWSYADLP
jgi:transposase-like protein